jgi:hypothetical protein
MLNQRSLWLLFYASKSSLPCDKNHLGVLASDTINVYQVPFIHEDLLYRLMQTSVPLQKMIQKIF